MESSAASTSYSSEDESDQDDVDVAKGCRVVEWPPAKDMQEMEDSVSSVTTSVRYVTRNVEGIEEGSQQHQHLVLSKELFSPGKLDVGSRWKPPSDESGSKSLDGAPKRKFKSLDEVLQNEATVAKHITYHVPPGTTRTRKAQECYEKHLGFHDKNIN